MKANVKGARGIELNCNYLKSVDGQFAYFYVPNEAISASLLNAVSTRGAIASVNKQADGKSWQVQTRVEFIEWED